MDDELEAFFRFVKELDWQLQKPLHGPHANEIEYTRWTIRCAIGNAMPELRRKLENENHQA